MTPTGSAPLPAPPPVDRFSTGAGAPVVTPPELPSRAPASPLSQVAVWITCSAAMVLVGTLAGEPIAAATYCLVLAVAIALGLLCRADRLFRWFAGMAAAAVTLIVMSIVCGLTGLPPALIPYCGVAVLGLDWTRVGRLRLPVWLAGLVVVFAVSTHQGWGLAVALGWLVLALGTLWSLEQDERAALDHPQPLDPGTLRADARTADLVTMIGVALAVGLLVAFLVGNPSCNLRLPGLGGGTRSGGSGGSGEYGERGRPDTFRDPETGRRYRIVPDQPGTVPDGGTYRRTPDGDVVIRDPDGTIRVYGAPGSGRPDLRVTDPNGDTRIFRYDDSSGTPRVTEYDRDGRVVKRYRYDPDGTWVDETGSGSGTGSPSSESPSSPPRKHRGPSPWWLLVPVVLAAALAAAWWYRSRRAEVPGDVAWALRLVEEIEQAGRERGRSRATSETIVDLTRALSTSVLPDPRLVDVGRVVSSALFDRADVDTYTRLWAQSTVTEIVAAHPVPSRRRQVAPSR